MSYYVPNNLLSKGGDAKTIKGEKKGWKTYIMYMSPFTDNSLGVNLCPHATAGCAAADHHAADLSGRQFLFDQYAAAGLADGGAVQPGGLSDQRLSLEFLRPGRCQPGPESGHDAGLSGPVVGCGQLDAENRL